MTSVTRRMARWCAQLGPFTTINIRPIAQQIYPILKRAKNLLSNTVKSHQNGEFRKIWSHWHPPSLSRCSTCAVLGTSLRLTLISHTNPTSRRAQFWTQSYYLTSLFLLSTNTHKLISNTDILPFSYLSVWLEKNHQMSITVAQKWFH